MKRFKVFKKDGVFINRLYKVMPDNQHRVLRPTEIKELRVSQEHFTLTISENTLDENGEYSVKLIDKSPFIVKNYRIIENDIIFTIEYIPTGKTIKLSNKNL